MPKICLEIRKIRFNSIHDLIVAPSLRRGDKVGVPGTCTCNFYSDMRRLNKRGWTVAQGNWQWDPLPPSCIVKWNVPFKPEQLGPGGLFRLQEEAQAMGLTINMRQRIRERGKL